MMKSETEETSAREEAEEAIKTIKPTCSQFVRSMILEPTYLLITLGIGMKMAVDSKFLLERVCLVTLNYTENVCANLSNDQNLTHRVENVANNYKVYIDLVEFVPAGIVGMFLGSWCDKYGRKAPVLIATCGMLLQALAYVYMASRPELSPLYFMLCSIPAGITGGLIVTLTNIYSMAVEMSTERNRTLKFGLLDLSKGLGFSFGSSIGGVLYIYGFTYAYGTSVLLMAVAGVWFLIVVSETVVAPIVPLKTKILDFFDISNIIEGFRTCCKPRENKGRLQIILLTLSMCILILNLIGSGMLEFMYVYLRFKWEPPYFSKVTTIVRIMEISATVVLVYFCTVRWKVAVTLLGIASSISTILGLLFKTFATRTWIYFMSCAAGLIGSLGFLAVRSIVSKLVPPNELGKLFAFIATCESITPVVGVVVFSQIYNNSPISFPGLVYLVIAVLSILPLVVFSWIHHLQKRSSDKKCLLKPPFSSEVKDYKGVDHNNATIQ